MKTRNWIAIVGALLGMGTAHAQWEQSLDLSTFPLISRDALPEFGTFWVKNADGFGAPMPIPPRGFAPIYQLDANTFVVDKTDVLVELGGGQALLMSADSMGAMNSISPPDDGGGEPLPEPIPDMRRNAVKFAGQSFVLIDTNTAALDEEYALIAACATFPENSSTEPNLQIKPFGSDAVLIKANHFDFSAETERDFALLVCHDIARPVWKSIWLDGSSDAEDGWLIQGMVSRYKVTDPMFLLVTNIAKDCNAFYQGRRI